MKTKRINDITLRLSGALASVWLLILGQPTFGQGGGGDDTIAGHVTDDLDSATLNAALDQLNRVDSASATAISGAISAGTIGVAATRRAGYVAAHGQDTIAIHPRAYPLWLRALALAHEWQHIGNIPPTAPAGAQDPTTDENANPDCASCNHADMTASDLDRMAALSCLEDPPPCNEFCTLYCLTLKRGNQNAAHQCELQQMFGFAIHVGAQI